MQTLRVFRLIPVAPPEANGWDLASNQGEVVVRAFSPADARIVAAAAEPDFSDISAKPGDGVSTAPASAFRDIGLYTVVEESGDRYPRDGERGVIAGTVDQDVIRPLEE